MHTVIKHTGGLFSKEVAEKKAAELNMVDEDGWTYTAIHDPKGTGLSFIEIKDENGDLVGKF